MRILLLLFAVHFIADFPLQGDWLGTQKGKNWELMIYHCLIYTLTFILLPFVPIWFLPVLFVSHIIVDSMKARWMIIKHIWIDQAIHLTILVLLSLSI